VNEKEMFVKTTAKKMTKLKRRICFFQKKNETCYSKTVLHLLFALPSNGLRYWRWGGRGLCLGAEKTRSQKNT
jgi:hypothetical protein